MRLLSSALAATCVATALGAQTAPSYAGGRPVRVGDRARIRAVERDASGRRVDCEARVTAVAGDTIVIENASRWGACPSRLYEPASLARAEFAHRSRGSRLLHTAVGVGVGAAAGAVGGVLAFGGADCVVGGGCRDEYAGIAGVFFGMIGGGVGGLIGLVMPAGAGWESLRETGPVRVAGLALRPSVRVSLR